jgi:clan AA aspartic protease (TIGR02281 family)
MAGGEYGDSGGAMLRWSFGYLAMAIVVAIGFSSLQGGDPPERRVASPPTRQSAAHAPGERARESHLEDEDHSEDEDYLEDDGYSEDEDSLENEGDLAVEDEPEEEGDLEYVVRAGSSGHFLIEAWVNGEPITFLVDTGASDIVLTLDDARRIGLEPRTLAFTQRFATANGEVRGAPVVLREIRVGQLRVFDMPASVNEAALEVSLLGMSFLEQLSGYEVRGTRLILRW